MPSLADSAVIFILALMLFGPKKLPQLARQLGKLMAEFRRASNEFRMQMEDELRVEEQKEHQRKVDAMAGPPSTLPDPEHPHLPSETAAVAEAAEPEPIAESGGLKMMPPSTGLPVESGAGRGIWNGMGGGSLDGLTIDNRPDFEQSEHSILPPEQTSTQSGMSSDEPAAAQQEEHHA